MEIRNGFVALNILNLMAGEGMYVLTVRWYDEMQRVLTCLWKSKGYFYI